MSETTAQVARLWWLVAGLVVWVLLIGPYAIAFGVLLLVVALRLRSAAKAPAAAPV
jgi:hypothetical protein